MNMLEFFLGFGLGLAAFANIRALILERRVKILEGCESSLNQRIRKLEEGGKRT
jgi:hypothetical protein